MADETITTADVPEITDPTLSERILVWKSSTAQQFQSTIANILKTVVTGAGRLITNDFDLTVPETMIAAGRNVANTFTATNTFEEKIYLRESIEGEILTLSDSAVQALSDWSAQTVGFAKVIDRTNGQGADFLLRGGYNQTVLIQQTGSAFSGTKDTASKINVYYDTDGYYVQNNSGGSRQISIILLG